MANNGILFSAGTEYLSTTVSLPSRDSCTIMGWYRFDGIQPNTFSILTQFSVGTSFTPVYQQLYATKDSSTIEIDNGQSFGVGNTWAIGTWYHYTQTFKNVGINDYHHDLLIDGQSILFRNTNAPINSSANDLYFGDPIGGNGFIGSVRNVKMFSECLEQEQVIEEMKVPYPIHYSCIGWWEMNGVDDLSDKVGGNNLSANGSIQTTQVGPPMLQTNSMPILSRKRTRGSLL
jgi:hypothetical protein